MIISTPRRRRRAGRVPAEGISSAALDDRGAPNPDTGPAGRPKCFDNTADLLGHWIATLSSAMGALGTMRLCEAHRARRTSYGCGILRCTASNRAGTIPVNTLSVKQFSGLTEIRGLQ